MAEQRYKSVVLFLPLMAPSNLDAFVDHLGSRSLNDVKVCRLLTFNDVKFRLILVPTFRKSYICKRPLPDFSSLHAIAPMIPTIAS